MSPQPRTTVVVVTWRGRDHIVDCLDALAAQNRPLWTIVVDNASDDGTAKLVATHPAVTTVLRLDTNTGYAGALAAALPVVETPYLAWLNDDAAPEPRWLAALESALDADPKAAAASARLVTETGKVQSLGVRLTADGHGADRTEAGEPFGFCGGAALLRTDVLRAVGGVPADFFCYYEDTDTSWRLRLAGWRIVGVPSAVVWHRHGASSQPGSPRFHRWNERNRLHMLLRCAPARVAAWQLVRFALVTAKVLVRREASGAANFRVGLRVGVLGEVLRRLPVTLRERARVRGNRKVLWAEWAGRG
ncbi:GT2 family glycosyltransferase [Crossiella equi]|uniref:GT2 family glycosyltransferase n=1 Tax=Crossiella equi TaxID=130796 RepID=A0ABS5ADE3_9PSEU|nr:glycosyltransferase [Crossiella equi]MBP2474600.1 GT2 family glycosyltransferase [Crossiella equi]